MTAQYANSRARTSTLNRCRARGFSMMELVSVMSIVGIMAALAMPKLMDRSSFDNMGAVDQLRSSLRYAQRVANARNRVVCVTVSNDVMVFMAAREPGNASACTAPLTMASSQALTDVVMPDGLTLAPSISFRILPDGRLSNAGGVALNRPTQTITILRDGAQTGVLSLHTENGFVL